MAAGDAVPVVGAVSAAPKGVVRAGGGRRRVEAEPAADVSDDTETTDVTDVAEETADVTPADLLAASAEVEAQLSVEEEIERRTGQEHIDAPHFRKDAE
jgi:hypothetical protein